MPFLKGEQIQLGLAKESTRGTFTSPSEWLRSSVPSTVTVEKETTEIQENIGSGMASQDTIKDMIMASGEVEYNVRNRTFPLLLLSLMGNISSSQTGDSSGNVYEHVLTIEESTPEHPSLSLALAKDGNFQHFGYPLALINDTEITVGTEGAASATSSFVAQDETDQSDFTPSYPSDDYLFPHHKAKLYFADSVSNLDSADKTSFKEVSISFDNNGEENQNADELTPSNMFAGLMSIEGTFSKDYEDETQADLHKSNDPKAMRLEIINDDETIGDSGNPEVTVELPKVTLESRDPDRSATDVVQEEIDFTAHFDEGQSSGGEVRVINEVQSY